MNDDENKEIATADKKKDPLAGLAAAISTALEQVDLHTRRFVTAVRVVGQNLLEVKARIEHGNWQPWVIENTPLSIRQAQLYMQFAQRMEQLTEEEAKRVSLLPFREAIKAVAGAKDRAHETDGEISIGDRPSAASESSDSSSKIIRGARAELGRFATDIDSGKRIGPARLKAIRSLLEDALGVVVGLQGKHSIGDGAGHDRERVATSRDELSCESVPFALQP
jgi:hypothetical protein